MARSRCSIEHHWRDTVAADDLVLLPGDLSMAQNHRELQPDLEWLERLPGTKIIGPGNHDRWWNNIAAVRLLLRKSILAVQGDAVAFNGIIVCGSVGTPVILDTTAPASDPRANPEIQSLDRALVRATEMRTAGETPLYVLWHYPPFNAHSQPGPCVELFERAGVTACVYGHLHSEREWTIAVQGIVRGVRYHCVAADAIGFRPLRIGTLSKDCAQA